METMDEQPPATGSSSHPTNAAKKPKIGKVLRVALILSVATGIEFLIAFTLPAGTLRMLIFVALTLVKAFYIVGEFMHLSHERRSMIWTIVFPAIFIVLLIFILLYESSHTIDAF